MYADTKGIFRQVDKRYSTSVYSEMLKNPFFLVRVDIRDYSAVMVNNVKKKVKGENLTFFSYLFVVKFFI